MEKKINQKSVFWDYFEALLIAVILALILRAFIVQAYKIPSGSMLNTLQIGDYLLVTRFSYNVKVPFTNKVLLETGDPQIGDIIVFRYPKDMSQDYIKRVVGVPGDVIEMRDKQLYRNGEKVVEPYIRNTSSRIVPGIDTMSPRVIPEGHYFVMGDNRDESSDSRDWGLVPRENIQGRAWIIYWSAGGLTDIRWNRIGTWLR